MKRCFCYGFGALLLAGPGRAQSLSGAWQGVETDTGKPGAYWPAVLRVQKNQGTDLFGVLYQELGGNPDVSVTFRMQGARTGSRMRLEHADKLNETGYTPTSYWCDGSITFTYDAGLEKLTGRATYRPVNDCGAGTFTLYRIRLKSPAVVPAGGPSTLRVSGRSVQWFADADLKQPVATGNTYRTQLRKTTTFYLKQDYYPTNQSKAVPITVRVASTPAKVAPPPAPVRPAPPRPLPGTLRIPPPAVVALAPVVLPTVLFRVGETELLPQAGPALDQLAAELQARPALQLRILGHTDRVGEPSKNQVLSERRAATVKDYLVRTGIAAKRLTSAGYGDTRPLYPSPDARNRRVEVEALP